MKPGSLFQASELDNVGGFQPEEITWLLTLSIDERALLYSRYQSTTIGSSVCGMPLNNNIQSHVGGTGGIP